MPFNRRKYIPKLPDFLSLCERNYAQLYHYLPQEPVVGHCSLFQVSAQDKYQIKVIDVARFTTTISIGLLNSHRRFLQPGFEVRLYHDARLAEVVACQHIRQFKAVYSYPNTEMLLPDEKRQINLLLRDWLQLCASQGYSASQVV